MTRVIKSKESKTAVNTVTGLVVKQDLRRPGRWWEEVRVGVGAIHAVGGTKTEDGFGSSEVDSLSGPPQKPSGAFWC